MTQPMDKYGLKCFLNTIFSLEFSLEHNYYVIITIMTVSNENLTFLNITGKFKLYKKIDII